MPVRLVNSSFQVGKYVSSSLEPPNFQTTSVTPDPAAGAVWAAAVWCRRGGGLAAAAAGVAAAAGWLAGVVAAGLGWAPAAAGAAVGAAGAGGWPQAASKVMPAVARMPRNTKVRRVKRVLDSTDGSSPTLIRLYLSVFHIWNERSQSEVGRA